MFVLISQLWSGVRNFPLALGFLQQQPISFLLLIANFLKNTKTIHHFSLFASHFFLSLLPSEFMGQLLFQSCPITVSQIFPLCFNSCYCHSLYSHAIKYASVFLEHRLYASMLLYTISNHQNFAILSHYTEKSHLKRLCNLSTVLDAGLECRFVQLQIINCPILHSAWTEMLCSWQWAHRNYLPWAGQNCKEKLCFKQNRWWALPVLLGRSAPLSVWLGSLQGPCHTQDTAVGISLVCLEEESCWTTPQVFMRPMKMS